jgi:acetylornithine deacetylase
MHLDPVDLAKELIAIPSVSRWSNEEINNVLESQLTNWGFSVERLAYVDSNGESKVSLVAKKGPGSGGLALISHTDTVPGQEQDWAAFSPRVEAGRLIGRGSCDMKGPLAATIAAAVGVEATSLKRPVFLVFAADEEVGGLGAQQVVRESLLLNSGGPTAGVIAEPTRLIPVHTHKGGCQMMVTAYGQAAHTSTDQGISANFLIAPFLAEMADLAKLLKSDRSFANQAFDPPTPGFNMVLDDGGCRSNVTAAKTTCTLSFRPMPHDRTDDLIAMITAKAARYDLEVSLRLMKPFYVSPHAAIVQAACQASAVAQPQSVPFGTDAFYFADGMELVVLGPGDIAQAHTVGEWIDIDQLHQAVTIYRQMIERICA